MPDYDLSRLSPRSFEQLIQSLAIKYIAPVAILRSTGKKVDLKGFDIWDYDKLRSMLDDAADIRRAYAAWITPGDVLLQAVESIASKPDFVDVMATFLQKELLEDQHVNLR